MRFDSYSDLITLEEDFQGTSELADDLWLKEGSGFYYVASVSQINLNVSILTHKSSKLKH